MNATDDTLQLWPLVMIVCDGYDEAAARIVIEAVKSFPEEAFSLIFGFAADRAREEMNAN